MVWLTQNLRKSQPFCYATGYAECVYFPAGKFEEWSYNERRADFAGADAHDSRDVGGEDLESVIS